MEKISLNDLLRTQWQITDPESLKGGTLAVDAARQRELKLNRVLPPQLVRRLDAGFARSATIHPETGQALYAICRARRAQNVFETGTYWGYSTAYLAAAMQDGGGSGRIWTFDIYKHAGKHIPKSLLPQVVLSRGKPSTETMPAVLEKVVPEIFFQDSRHDYEGVAEELNVVVPKLGPGAVVLLHDFILPDVRRAATELLNGFTLSILDIADPQQLGVAIKDS